VSNCDSYEVSINQCHGPAIGVRVQQSVSWSWWTMVSVMVHQSVSWSILQSLVVSLVLSHLDYVTSLQQVSRRTNLTSAPVSDQRRGPTWRFHHITPLLLQPHQLRTPEWIQYKLVILAFRCCNALTWPMKYSSLRTSRLNPAYNLRGRHHCLSAVHGCQLSTIKLLRLPLLVFRTLCRAMHHLCWFSRTPPLCLFIFLTLYCTWSASHYWTL